ncbi:ClpP/crotonase-like domain-containing protein [Hyaloscypha finlandica]|nr:ClpP/crotonase-like domain-containing protein [Hyaloscypha finlandica]
MKGLLQSILTFAGILRPELPSMDESSLPSLPSDHPASIQLSAWLEAFNIGDKEKLLTYHKSNFPYNIIGNDIRGIQDELELARMTGGFRIADIESTSAPPTVVVVLQGKNRRNYGRRYDRVSMEVDISKPNNPVMAFEINAINTPLKLIRQGDPRRSTYEKAYRPLTSVLRQKVVHGLAKVIREQYIYPELGRDIIGALETYLKNGQYEAYSNSEDFAQRLTEDIQAAGHDKHMSIDFDEPPEDEGWNIFLSKQRKMTLLEELRGMNFGFGSISFDKVSVPGKTIATLPIDGFVPSDELEVRTAIGEIMSSIADADALLVDLRVNHGGDPDTIAFMESYILTDAPVHLLDFVDRSGKVKDSFSTLPASKLPAGSKLFGGSKPLFVLTSNETSFGGEDMAYNLQAFKRASAIVGEGNESTAGAAHTINTPQYVCEKDFGKMWWFVAVPNLKPVHEITRTNWEGIGVKSDVIAGEGDWKGVADAKEVATRLLMKSLKPGQEL